MIGHDLQHCVEIHDAEILQELDDWFSGALEFALDFFELQVVDLVIFFDQRKEGRYGKFLRHRACCVFRVACCAKGSLDWLSLLGFDAHGLGKFQFLQFRLNGDRILRFGDNFFARDHACEIFLN